MFSTLRTRFGIPGVISVMALIFAMFGGAYAASNSNDGGGKATASAKAKRGPRGPKGPAGPQGPQGLAGPQGAVGANGKDGANGASGKDGTNGANGQSVTAAIEPPFGECGDQEGVKLTSASGVNYVCNGANGAPGAQGPKGDPWTAGGTLPTDATETGAWGLSASSDEETTGFGVGLVVTSVSFPIPLASPATAHYVGPSAPIPADCENSTHVGTASVTNPEAKAGHLCVYAGGATTGEPDLKFFSFADPGISSVETGLSGVHLLFEIAGENAVMVQGSWAVTG